MAEQAIEPRKRPRQARATHTVEAILEAAARILEGQGLSAFNTNAVAERAGVSIGTLYQYFPAKEAILVALIRRKREGLLAALRAAAEEGRGLTLVETVTRLVSAALSLQRQRPGLARSLDYADALLPIDGETTALKQAIMARIAALLAGHGIADPEMAARDLVALVHGMADAAGLYGETDIASLETRITRAALGYLGLDGGRKVRL